MTFLERAKELVSKMTIEEKMAQMRYDAPAIPRLGVPAYNWWNECLHGVARQGCATVFPQNAAKTMTQNNRHFFIYFYFNFNSFQSFPHFGDATIVGV